MEGTMRRIGRARWIGHRAVLPVLVATLVLGAASGAGLPRAAYADGAWLDDQSVTWNWAGMPIPGPVDMQSNLEPRCAQQARPAESDEDRAVEAAGWTLFANYTAGWGIKIINGLAGYDGMCRPIQYQGLVFVDGVLAGTLSPMPMDSRTDGALSRTAFFGPESLTATYVRYTDKDPLCCPSALSTVTYKIERTPGGPVLVRESTNTQPTNPAGP